MDFKKIIDQKDKAAKYMIDEITHIIKTCGKRDPGSEGEKNPANIWQKFLKKTAAVKKSSLSLMRLHPALSTVGFISQ